MEILAVLVVALVVFGPQRLPELARSVGKTISQLKQTADDLRSEFEAGFDFEEEEDEAHDGDYEESPRTAEVRARSNEPAEVIPDKDNLEERAEADERRVTDATNGPASRDARGSTEEVPEVKRSARSSAGGGPDNS